MPSTAAAAFDVFQDARGMVIFYMFILEEAAQTLSLGAYMANRDNDKTTCQQLAQFNKDNVLAYGKDFASTIGIIGYPMNEAFSAFFDATDKVMDYYLKA